MPRTLLPFVFVGVTFLVSCSDEGDCVSLCEEGQDRDCTSISGDCGDFCDALFSVEDPSGCSDERERYQDCLNEEGVCGGCDGEEDALSTCVGRYCLAHGDSGDCQTLSASL